MSNNPQSDLYEILEMLTPPISTRDNGEKFIHDDNWQKSLTAARKLSRVFVENMDLVGAIPLSSNDRLRLLVLLELDCHIATNLALANAAERLGLSQELRRISVEAKKEALERVQKSREHQMTTNK